jgi:putative Holliday junction resolvase
MPAEGRVLGIDPGSSRVGLALSDSLGISAQGLETYRRGRGSFMEHLAGIIEGEGVHRIVLGLPLNMDGSEGDAARASRQLAAKLRERFGLPVVLWDERLSSVAARRAFPPGSRKDWDRIAAVFILQSYLDSLRQDETP